MPYATPDKPITLHLSLEEALLLEGMIRKELLLVGLYRVEQDLKALLDKRTEPK